MRYRILTDESEAIAYEEKCALAAGYPKRGVDIGGGRHVGPDQGWTLKHSEVITHKDQPLFAVKLMAEIDDQDRAEAKEVTLTDKLDGWIEERGEITALGIQVTP